MCNVTEITSNPNPHLFKQQKKRLFNAIGSYTIKLQTIITDFERH